VVVLPIELMLYDGVEFMMMDWRRLSTMLLYPSWAHSLLIVTRFSLASCPRRWHTVPWYAWYPTSPELLEHYESQMLKGVCWSSIGLIVIELGGA
jgi:hypothetical protein